MKNHTLPVTSHFCFMYNNKTLRYEKRATLELSCPMNFALYPHDTHRCRIQVESSKCINVFLLFLLILMKWNDFIRKWLTSSMIWSIDSHEWISWIRSQFRRWYWWILLLPIVSIQFDCAIDCIFIESLITIEGTRSYTSGRYSCVEIVFLLQRDMGYYLINTYIPTCAIVTVSVSQKYHFQIKKKMAEAHLLYSAVDHILDSTRSIAISRYTWCDLAVDPVDATQ